MECDSGRPKGFSSENQLLKNLVSLEEKNIVWQLAEKILRDNLMIGSNRNQIPLRQLNFLSLGEKRKIFCFCTFEFETSANGLLDMLNMMLQF